MYHDIKSRKAKRKMFYIKVSFAFLLCLWSGLIIGVSFIATPVKFLAETLDLSAALDVGKHTFNVFTKVEWFLLSILLFFNAIERFPFFKTSITFILAIILLMQTFWLLPELTAQVDAVIKGTPMSPSIHHIFYSLLEGFKFLFTITLSFALFTQELS